MREDPIIFEDWIIGTPKYFSTRKFAIAEYLISMILSLIMMSMGLKQEDAFIIYTWLFTLVILTGVEILGDHVKRTFGAKLVTNFILLFMITSTVEVDRIDIIFIIITFLLTFKFLLAPISVILNQINQSILVPRDSDTFEKLASQINRLSGTDYEITGKDNYNKIIYSHIIDIIKKYVILLAVFIMIFIVSSNGLYISISVLFSSFIILNLFLTIFIRWEIVKYLARKKTVSNIEVMKPVEVFPSK